MIFLVDKTLTLAEFLKTKFPDSSNRTISNWIKNGRIIIDNTVITKSSYIVKKDQEVTFKSNEKRLPLKINIVYEDPHFIIVDKPPNILSVPKDTPHSTNVLKILRKNYNTLNIFAVHRIDKKTSGLLVYAKSKQCLSLFKEIFKKHDITRKYLAIVNGSFTEESGTIENYLIEKQDLKVYITSKEYGVKAITHYKTLHRNNNFSFLSLTLETGKKHQIRVQLKNIGYPVVGDKKYGEEKNPIKRMALHAYLLEFTHPFTRKKVSFLSPIPKEFFFLGAEKIKKLI